MKFNTINPATEETIAEYETMSKDEVLSVSKSCHMAYSKWKLFSFSEKSKLFNSLAKVLRDNKEEYAKLMTVEMGKPIKESLAEVEKCAWLCDILADNGQKWLADEEVKADGKKHLLTFEPLGTIFIIMPWNFPFWQAFKVALPPLMAGNTIILKHAKNVTGCSLAIEDAFKKAGFPENVFRSVIMENKDTYDLIASNYVQGVSLTGSVGAGSIIASEAGKSIKKIVLELGGSDPCIILDDANIDEAVKGSVLGRMLNAGQVCTSSKRLIVMDKVAEEFTRKYAEAVNQLKVGNPLDTEIQVGPLADKGAVHAMEKFVEDAKAKGAKILAGGKRPEGKGYYFEPTVLSNINPKMSVACNEVFGPVAPIIVVHSEEEAIRLANDSEFGLSSCIWTTDQKRAERIARRIETGAVFINAITRSHPMLPIGGIKKSGFGNELSHYGIKEFVNIKSINFY